MTAKEKALKSLYIRGVVTKDGLRKAVSDGIITQQEYYEITGEETV